MRYDVIIAGGAAMGCATAYHLLLREPTLSLVVVEPDFTYERASTTLSDGNVRIQFNLRENVEISQFAMDVADTFARDMAVGDVRPEVTPRRQGNLFMADDATHDAARAGLEMQQSLGCNVTWLDREALKARFPPYASPEFIGGTYGPDDGSVDPTTILHGYRRKAAAMGATMLTGRVAQITRDDATVTGVVLASGDKLEASVVLNATGAWATDLASTVGVSLPVEPVMRNVFVVDTHVDTADLPSVFAPSGLYVIPEHGKTFLVAWSQPDDPLGYDFVVSRQRFYDRIWPELVRNFPVFDALDVVGGWAGLYAVNTLDGNAIVGEWPHLRGLYLANGFSGHGFQQCHAVGRHLAELMLELPPSLDLSRLGPQRIVDGTPLYEHAGRII